MGCGREKGGNKHVVGSKRKAEVFVTIDSVSGGNLFILANL